VAGIGYGYWRDKAGAGRKSRGHSRDGMREMQWILGIGLAAGVPAALALARLTQNQLSA